jgi:leader peptidase (prepilin peptidase)/N-methyltransferase
MLFISVILAFLGLCLGSFVNALVWRLHEHKDWVKARSQCTHCGHVLASSDLLPVLSWVYLRGKCRYCGKRISWQYPAVELAAAVVFVASYIYWPGSLSDSGNLALFVAWLAASVGLLALALYDLKWMLLPNRLIYPTLAVAVLGNIAYLLSSTPNKAHFLLSWLASIIVASGVFLTLYIISQGRWIGFGDVRLGLVTGTLIHSPGKSLLMIFLASLIGTILALPLLASGKKALGAKLPYGPFLIVASFICVVWGDSLIDWYKKLFLP